MELLREQFYYVDLFEPMKRIRAEGALAMRDNKADRIGAHVKVKGIAADLTGYSVKGYFVRASIETIELDGGIDGNLAYVDLEKNCYKYDGSYTLTIKLVKDDAEISLLIVTGRVLATSTDTLVVTEDMISEKEMLEKLNAIGNLDDLETINKTNLVKAINEANRNGGGTGSGGTQGTPGNAPNIYVVSFGLQESGVYMADKTQSDVDQAIEGGKAVLLVDRLLGHIYMYAATELSESFELYSVFYSVPFDDGEATITTVARLGEDGKVELTPKSADDPNKKLDKSGWAPNKVLTTDADGNVVATEIEIQSPDSPDTPVEEIAVHGVTPQMFGAVGDGVADDTDAVQAALDNGGVIYFPAGRYKVTKQLTATKSCTIKMFKPYPCSSSADYPLTSADNWMGSRIETYTSDPYGLLIGDGVIVDGLNVRAMTGFAGVLLKFDGTLGAKTYPSQVRLSCIRLDCNAYNTNPTSMFDFMPTGTYFAVLDDIMIGSLHTRQICDYGFRAVLSDRWVNSVIINNLCIDILADYPLYLDGGGVAMSNWIFDGLNVQAYPYNKDDKYYMYRAGHVNVITLLNMSDIIFSKANVWDLHAASVLDEVFRVENQNGTAVACFGCSDEFDSIETVMSAKLKAAADNLNISKLNMIVEGVEETGANRLILSDGQHEQSVDIPSVSVSDGQLDRNISGWFEANAVPNILIGRNKFNPYDNQTQNGYLDSTTHQFYQDDSYTLSHYIEAKYLDIICSSVAGRDVMPYKVYCFDADKNYLATQNTATLPLGPFTIDTENTAYIRLQWSDVFFLYADRATAKVMVTINDNLNTSWEDRVYVPYKETAVGGLGKYIVLQSPNGTPYNITVNNEGALVAVPVGGSVEEEVVVDWNISSRTAIMVKFRTPTHARSIDFDTYLLGVTRNGYWNEQDAPNVTVNGEDFVADFTSYTYGVGVPVKLRSNNVHVFSFSCDHACSVSLTYYDENGVYCDFESLIPEDSEPGTYSTTFIAKSYAFPMIVFTSREISEPVTFSGIALGVIEQ